jgi:DNA-directed RNA polymerase subunit M
MFCPKCGGLLLPKKGKFTCVKCKHVKKEMEDTKISESIKEDKEVVVVDKEHDPSPVIDAKCNKCGHGKAKFWTVQTRASDEPETKFLKCEKCKHTWRDYD